MKLNMKLKKSALAALCALLCASAVSAKKAPKIVLPTVMDTFAPNKTNRQLGYQLVDGGKTVVFVFDSSVYRIQKPKKVFVEGSFNSWRKGAGAWELSPFSGTVWTLECPAESVKAPGNSGFPEFKFYVVADVTKIESLAGMQLERTREEKLEPNAVSKIAGYQMGGNNLILFAGDSPETVLENIAVSERVKKLSEFNLDRAEDRAMISNFRLVPGTTKLFRGYHPYKMSRPNYDTEKRRIAIVNEELAANGIKSIITLSGDEKLAKNEEVSLDILAMRAVGNQLFVDTSYNTVYYHSDGFDFGNIVKQIVEFINSHPGPYYVHCRLGTDRTGTVSAVLGALCGASWEDIKADYQKSNDMGIKEFRDYRLLRYSFERLIGMPPEEAGDLQKAVAAHFVDGHYLTQDDIGKLVSNLK